MLTASSRSTGLPPSLFGKPSRIGRLSLSPIPGVNCWSISRTCMNLGACCSKLSYPRLSPSRTFILVSVMLLSVNSIVIRFRNSAVFSSTPIPVEGMMLCPIKYLALTIFPVSTVQISSLCDVLFLSGEYGAFLGSYPVMPTGASTLSIRVFWRLDNMGFSMSGVFVRDMGQYAAFRFSSM